MAKLKKSVKAIIISLCLVVVLAGSAVGAIFASKGKGDNGSNNTNPPSSGQTTPVTPITPSTVYELTEEQKNLVASINQTANTSVEVASKYNYDNYVGNGFLIDVDKVLKDYGNFLSYKDSTKTILVKMLKNNHEVYVDIFDLIIDDENVIQTKINELTEYGYVNAEFIYFDEQTDKYVLKSLVLDLNTQYEVKIVKEFSYEETLLEDIKLRENSYYILFFTNYFGKSEKSGETNNIYSLTIYDYDSNEILFVDDVTKAEDRSFGDNSYYIDIAGKLYYGAIVDGEFKNYVMNVDVDSVYKYKLTKDYLFIEKQILAEPGDLTAVGGVNYLYSLIKLSTNEELVLNVENGYSKLTFDAIDSEYYYLFEQKVVNGEIENSGLMVYFDNNGNKIVSYQAKSNNDKIVYSNGTCILTHNGVYTTEKSVNAVQIFAFGEDERIEKDTINNKTFALYNSLDYYIYDICGNKIFDQPFRKIYSYNDGIYIGMYNNVYYLADVNNKQLTKIEDFINDVNQYNYKLVFNGGGYYLTQNEDNIYKTLHKFNGEVVYDDVKTFELINKSKTHLKIIFGDDSFETYELGVVLTVNSSKMQEEKKNNTEPQSVTYATSGDGWEASTKIYDADTSVFYKCTKDGYYTSSGYVNCNGNSIFNWLGDSNYYWSYDYSSDSASMTSGDWVTHVTGYGWDISSSSKYYKIIIEGHYNEKHIGDLKNCTADLSKLYAEAYGYAMPDSKDYDDAHTVSNYTESRSTTSSVYSVIDKDQMDVIVPKGNSSGIKGGKVNGYTKLYTSARTSTCTSTATYKAPTSKYIKYNGTWGWQYYFTIDSSFFYNKYGPSTYYTYATYAQYSYAITYDYNGGKAKSGGSYPSSANYSDDITIDPAVRMGYTFAGWEVKNGSTTIYSSTKSTSFTKLTTASGQTINFKALWTANKFNIKFAINNPNSETDDYTIDSNAEKTYDSAFTVNNPTKTGYTFTGWTITGMDTTCPSTGDTVTHYYGASGTTTSASISSTKETSFKNLRSVSGDVTFTANWSANQYAISFNYGDGGYLPTGKSNPSTGTFDTFFKVEIPIKTGYTFASWKITDATTTGVNSKNVKHYYGNNTSATTNFTGATQDNLNYSHFKNLRHISGTVTLTANWTANTYQIDFDINNPNSVTNDYTIDADTSKTFNTAFSVNNPTKVGYIFTHWLIQGMDQTSAVTGDTITHYHGTSSSDSNLTGFTGETIDNVTSNWFKNLRSTEKNASGTVVKVKFIAQWTPIIYSIKYDTNSGQFASGVNNPTTNIRYDWEIANGETLIIQSPLRHGYDFTGWEISSKNSNFTTYTDSHTIRYPSTTDVGYDNLTTSHGDEITFKALWAATTYTVSLIYNNPTKSNETKTFTFDQEHTIPNPTRMGYIFKDWTITGCSACDTEDFECKHKYGSTEFTGVSVNQITATTFKNLHCIYNSVVTFTANWTAKEYNIQLGSETSGYGIEYTQKPKYDEWFSIKAPTSYKLGYHFGGWVVTQMNNKDENTNETVNHFYGTSTSSTSKVNGTEMTREITNTTYYFKNLSSNNNATVIITVIWVANNYVVTFDLNNPNWVIGDNSTQADITATYDEKFTVSKPTKAGYRFLGWSLYELSNDCDHYYASNATATMTKFTTDNGRFVNSATGKDAVVDVTCFKNLRSDHNSGTKALLKANWEAREYNIVYHYLPASLDVTAYQKEELNTKINIASMMTQTITVTVTYDRIYTALNYKDNEEENEFYAFGLPIGLRLICWSISADAVAGTTVLGKYQTVSGEQVIVSNLSDSIVPFEERMYGPGKNQANYTGWIFYPENPDSDKEIHLYATYDLAGIKLRYYYPTSSSGRNYLESYKNVENNVFGVDLSGLNTSAKYTEVVTFANSSNIPYYDSLVGYMIVATYDSSGQLTKDSLTRYTYQGTTYVAYKGNQAHWGFTNVDAYSYEDPTYFLYAIYDEEYSGNFDKLHFAYNSSSQTYSVAGTVTSVSSIKIPSHYDNGTTGYKPVTKITSQAFKGFSSLSNVIIPNTVITIDASAFYGCSSLTSIILPNSLKTIGTSAFQTSGLNTSVVMPNSLETIEISAFAGLTGNATFVLNEGLRIIDTNAFGGNTFTSITLPSTLIDLGMAAFENCSNLTSITIPKGVKNIYYHAFNNCSSLASISFEPVSSLILIGEGAFENCIALTSINIPNSVKTIGSSAFNGCTSLEIVTMPDELISLGMSAFNRCSALTSIVIPQGITTIDTYTFAFCSNLETITIYDGITSISSYAFMDCESLINVVIPKSVQSIGFAAFANCSSITSITLPFVGYSRTEETDNHFGYIFGASDASVNDSCVPVSLTSVTITDDETIDEYAFNSCFTITSLTISDTVTSIGYCAFFNSYSIVTLTVPFIGLNRTDADTGYFGYWHDQAIDTEIDDYLTSLTTVNVTDATAIYANALYCATSVTTLTLNEGITSIGNLAFKSLRISTVALPSTLTTIGESSFATCPNLSYVNLNEGLTTIGSAAFDTCSSLNNVVIPSTVTTIGASAFWRCSSMTNLVILDGVTDIQYSAFIYCTALKTVRLPKTITTISGNMFKGCTALETVHIQEGVTTIATEAFNGCTSLKNITLPSTVTSFGDYAFNGCTSTNFNTLIMPDAVTTIGGSAFRGCSNLSSVKLSKNLTSIGNYAFAGIKISRIEIPNGVTTIGANAFESCASLNTVIFYKSVTSVGNYAFNSSSIAHVYYGGTTDEFIALSLNSTNQYLINALEITNYDKMIFTYTGSSYSIKGTGSVSGELTIPTYYNDGVNGNYVVDEIENSAFNGHSNITSVTMSNNVKIIGNLAFRDCTSMASITMSTALTEIGTYAFYNCNAITSINIPTNITVINAYTFYSCDALTTVTFSSSTKLKIIDKHAFYYCANLVDIIIPNSVTIIKSHAFYNCQKLSSGELKLPTSLTTIEYYAFYNCEAVERVVFPRSLTNLAERVFSNCDHLSFVYIPNTLTTISAHAYDYSPFYSCEDLVIFTECDSKLSGWGPYWNSHSSTKQCITFYDYDTIPDVKFGNNTSKNNQQLENGIISNTTSGSFYIYAYGDYLNVRFDYKVINNAEFNLYVYDENASTGEYIKAYYASMTDFESFNFLLTPNTYLRIYCATSNALFIKNLQFDNIDAKYYMNQSSTYYTFGYATTNDLVNRTHDMASLNYNIHSSDAYFTINAQDYIDVSFEYLISSESTHDYLAVTLNGSEVLRKSGTSVTAYTPVLYELAKGDVLTIRYRKDHSVHTGDDRVFINKLQIKSKVLFMDNTNSSYGAPVTTYDYTHIELYTEGEWETIGGYFTTKKYDSKLIFKYRILDDYTPLEGFGGIRLQATTTYGNESLLSYEVDGVDLALDEGVYLAELTIPNPGSYYILLNFGHAADSQTIIMDIGCVYSYGFNTSRQDISNFDTRYYGVNSFSVFEYVSSEGNITAANSVGDYYSNAGTITGKFDNSSMEYAIYAPYSLLVTFDMYVSSENTFDYVVIYIDTTEVKRMSGNVDWTNYAFSLNAGQTLRIAYSRDGSVNAGIDGYYLKNLSISRDYGFAYNSSTGAYTSNNVNVQNSTSTYVYQTYTSAKTVSFSYELSSENYNDRLLVYLNGELIFSSYGTTSGTFSKYVYANSSLIIMYVKDDNINGGSDTCKLTNMTV